MPIQQTRHHLGHTVPRCRSEIQKNTVDPFFNTSLGKLIAGLKDQSPQEFSPERFTHYPPYVDSRGLCSPHVAEDNEQGEDDEAEYNDAFERARLISMLESVNSIFMSNPFSMNLRKDANVPCIMDEEDTSLTLRIFLCGIKKDQFSIYLEDDDLVIQGRLPQWLVGMRNKMIDLASDVGFQDDPILQKIRDNGEFELRTPLENTGDRTFNLEGIQASYEDGLLTIFVPYMPLPEPKKIAITVA